MIFWTLTEDYAALYKENAALKSKLKVVADKLEEYREVEDAMRSTLLTAQKMASSMVSEAEPSGTPHCRRRRRRQARLEEIQQELADQEQRLADAPGGGGHSAEERAWPRASRGCGLYPVRPGVPGPAGLLQRLPELPVQPRPPRRRRPTARPARGQRRRGGGEKDIDAPWRLDARGERPGTGEGRWTPRRPGRPREPEPTRWRRDADATRVLNLDDLQFGRNYTKE